ncbi:hypothetical protein LCGC14_2711370 [marine sediment metagenome]|uniref:Uncharacterized protein n=1 Tax=marine sediment metagenome TaxID=412755 RepID=A0A0F9A0K9_9ZZZZ
MKMKRLLVVLGVLAWFYFGTTFIYNSRFVPYRLDESQLWLGSFIVWILFTIGVIVGVAILGAIVYSVGKWVMGKD